jgi:hypothetical protein
MRLGLALSLILPLTAGSVLADGAAQTDWSGGGGVTGPVANWGSTFESANATSWMSVPGQLALSSAPLPSPIEHRIDAAFDGALCVHTVDIDDDGDQDIVGTAYYADDAVLWRNDGGDPIQWTSQTIDADLGGGCETFAADVDGDGDLDLLGAGFTAGVVWWRNDGGDPIQWVREDICADFAGGHDVWAGDLDGDGDTDVAGVAAEDDEIAWWRNDGGDPITWVEQVIDGTVDYPCRLDVKDIDGDGILDVAATSWNDATVAWWRNDGADPIGWIRQDIRTGYTGTHGLHVCDVDLDGDNDVLGAAMNLGDVTWWSNGGGDPIAWQEHVIAGNFPGAGYVYPQDIDGDGDVDVVGSAWGSGGIAWWENTNAVGTAWTRHQVITGVGQTSCVYASDVDGDGDTDVLGTGFDTDFLSWWEVTDFVASGELTGSILDSGTAPHTIQIDWAAVAPVGTDLRFRLRSSGDPADMGAWSSDISSPGPVAGALHRYVQYRVILETTDPGISPILEEVALTWEQLGTDDAGVLPQEPSLYRCAPNPANQEAVATLCLPTDCHVRLRVFGQNGRCAGTLAEGTLRPGVCRLPFRVAHLRPGVYLCRLEGDGLSATQRLVISR